MSRTPTTNHKESLLITAGRYLGEVVRERFGGQWELPLSDPSNVNYNQPVVMRHGAEGLEFAPVSVIRGFVKKRQRGLLARAVASQVSPAKLDLAELVWKEKTSDV